MGNYIANDPSRLLQRTPQSPNCVQLRELTSLLCSEGIMTDHYRKMFNKDSSLFYKGIYRIVNDGYVQVQLTKSQESPQPAILVQLSGERVFGYNIINHKKGLVSQQILFKKRIAIEEEDVQKAIRTFAEIKYLAMKGLGLQLGRAIDDSDGYLTDQYIEYFGELGVYCEHPNSENKLVVELEEELTNAGFEITQKLLRTIYSQFEGKLVAFTGKDADKFPKQSVPLSTLSSTQMPLIKTLVNDFNYKTKQLSSIENDLLHRHVSGALETFSLYFDQLQGNSKLEYLNQVQKLFRRLQLRHTRYLTYKVVEWTRETKDILKTSPAEQTFLSDSSYFVEADVEQDNKDLSMVPILKPDTPESDRFHRRLSIEQISCSTFHSNMPIASGMQVNDYLSKGFSRESLPEKAVRLEHRLREAIEVGEARKVQLAMAELEAIEIMTPLQLEMLYGRILMESGYLRKAMKTFQRIVRLHKGSVNHDYILCEVTAMMGMIHYTKGNYSEAYNVYNRSLQLRLRLKDYGCSTMAIFNNVACLNYFEGRFEQSVQMLKQGWHLSGRSDNYDLLLRTNLGMVLMTKNHLQEAKYQLELINTCQCSNLEIRMKYHSNLGYVQLCNGNYELARTNFDLACSIEEIYLLPDGDKPSIFLHNNFAMYYYSKGEYRRSANHFTFIEDQLDHLAFSKPYLALQIRYNIGKVYMQLLNPDRASSEFIECKLLLPRIDSLKMLQLKDKIDNEIYNLQVQRIEEVSFQFESSRNSAELQDITPFT